MDNRTFTEFAEPATAFRPQTIAAVRTGFPDLELAVRFLSAHQRDRALAMLGLALVILEVASPSVDHEACSRHEHPQNHGESVGKPSNPTDIRLPAVANNTITKEGEACPSSLAAPGEAPAMRVVDAIIDFLFRTPPNRPTGRAEIDFFLASGMNRILPSDAVRELARQWSDLACRPSKEGGEKTFRRALDGLAEPVLQLTQWLRSSHEPLAGDLHLIARTFIRGLIRERFTDRKRTDVSLNTVRDHVRRSAKEIGQGIALLPCLSDDEQRCVRLIAALALQRLHYIAHQTNSSRSTYRDRFAALRIALTGNDRRLEQLADAIVASTASDVKTTPTS